MRLPFGELTPSSGSGGGYMEVTFTHRFPLSNDAAGGYRNAGEERRGANGINNLGGPTIKTYFALCEPFSYEDCQAYLVEMERKLQKNQQIYFCRELLTHTLDKRRVDLLTITSYKDVTFEREAPIEGLFPELKMMGSLRPYKARKPIIFVSARVHPGEVPGSHILRGILDFLTPQRTPSKYATSSTASDTHLDPRAITLMNHFVIKVVPMLNPDGVARGHFRFDTLGQNLNRHYEEPDPTK